MLPGFNHNVRHQARVFHVQTEDSGLNLSKLITQLFLDGHVLAVERSDYKDLLELPQSERNARIRSRMQAQHKGVLRRLVDGGFDGTLQRFLDGSDSVDTEDCVDPRLPVGVLATSEVLAVAHAGFGESAALEAKSSVLGPSIPLPVEIDDIRFEDIVGSLEEWDASSEPQSAGDGPNPQPRKIPAQRDTLVDVRLPAALRAAQERLRAEGLRGDAHAEIRQVPVRGRPGATRRGRQVPWMAPESSTGPSGSSPTIPSGPPHGFRSRSGGGEPGDGPGSSRRPRAIPSNDNTMLEIDPTALKEAMARQRARLEAQRTRESEQDDEAIVVSEPSLDEVIMSYLKDEN